MIVRGNKLVRYVVFCHELFESGRAFIVEELDFGGESVSKKVVINDGECSCELLVLAALSSI